MWSMTRSSTPFINHSHTINNHLTFYANTSYMWQINFRIALLSCGTDHTLGLKCNSFVQCSALPKEVDFPPCSAMESAWQVESANKSSNCSLPKTGSILLVVFGHEVTEQVICKQQISGFKLKRPICNSIWQLPGNVYLYYVHTAWKLTTA